MADGAGLPAQRVYSEGLIFSTGRAVLDESCWMPWLRLDLNHCLILPSQLFLWDGFRQTLKVLFAELELRHSLPGHYASFSRLEHYAGPMSMPGFTIRCVMTMRLPKLWLSKAAGVGDGRLLQ